MWTKAANKYCSFLLAISKRQTIPTHWPPNPRSAPDSTQPAVNDSLTLCPDRSTSSPSPPPPPPLPLTDGGPSVSRMTLSLPLSVDTGVALQADPGLAEPWADWALEVRICRWDRGCSVAAFSGGLCLVATLFL